MTFQSNIWEVGRVLECTKQKVTGYNAAKSGEVPGTCVCVCIFMLRSSNKYLKS